MFYIHYWPYHPLAFELPRHFRIQKVVTYSSMLQKGIARTRFRRRISEVQHYNMQHGLATGCSSIWNQSCDLNCSNGAFLYIVRVQLRPEPLNVTGAVSQASGKKAMGHKQLEPQLSFEHKIFRHFIKIK